MSPRLKTFLYPNCVKTRKISYPTRAQASKDRRTLPIQEGILIYPCGYCKGWHLGHGGMR